MEECLDEFPLTFLPISEEERFTCPAVDPVLVIIALFGGNIDFNEYDHIYTWQSSNTNVYRESEGYKCGVLIMTDRHSLT